MPDSEEEEWEDEVDVEEAPTPLDARGLPEKGPYGGANPAIVYPIATLVMLGLGYLIAWGIYSLGWEKYDAKVAVLRLHDLGYLYLAVFVVSLVLPIQQVFVAYHRKLSKVENPDQYAFKTMLRDEPYVLLERQGAVGAFNRAQRGIDNTREIIVRDVVNLVFAGYVFPEAVFAMSILYLVGRVGYSAGYIGWPCKSRAPGMALSMIASIVINGLQLFATTLIFRSPSAA